MNSRRRNIINKFISKRYTEEEIVTWRNKWNEFYKPSIKSYTYKLFSVSISSLFYLLFLTLFKFEMTWLNFSAAIGTYFIVEDIKSYFLTLKKTGNKG